MPVTDAYATAAEYRAAMGGVDVGRDADIELDLLAISRYLDERLGRFFTKDAAPVVRVFQVPPVLVPDRWLYVTDLAAAPTEVLIDSDGDHSFAGETPLVLGTDYQLWPRNAPLGPSPKPYEALIPISRVWIEDRDVQITAVWGWPEIPLPIKRAAIRITALLRLETPRATATVNEMGERISTSREAQGIVNDLVERYPKGLF